MIALINNENKNDGFDNNNNIKNTDNNEMKKIFSLQEGIDNDDNNNNEVVVVHENWEKLRQYLNFAIHAYEVNTDELWNKLEVEDF